MLAPTFNALTNWAVDILLDNGLGTVTAKYTYYFPEKRYFVDNCFNPMDSVIHVLNVEVNKIIQGDAFFGNPFIPFSLFANKGYDDKLELTIFPQTTCPNRIKFLWKTGANSAISAAEVLGFTKTADTPFITSTNLIRSPNKINLNNSNYIDISIDGIENNPIERIFFNDQDYLFQNELNITRTRIFQNNPIRRLKKMRIRLQPENLQNLTLSEMQSHDLIFTFFVLSFEQSIPRWLNQSFAI